MIRSKLAAAWWNDLSLERGGLRARKTGALIPYKRENIVAIARGFMVYLMTQGLRLGAAFMPGRPLSMAFLPHRPQPWYLIWPVLYAAGGRITSNARTADAVFFFEDITTSDANHVMDALSQGASGKMINLACTDVSKSRVARVFEEVFGYPLAIDPRTWHGPAVEKSEINGAHDGRIVQCPCAPKADRVYARLIDNSDDGRMVEDYRSPTIDGEIPLVFIKKRAMDKRFANSNDKVILRRTEQIFSPEERDLLRLFCQKMHMQWGGIDVLRDRKDGRIYVVDVNKTDMGPPTALPLIDQFRAIRRLARALRTYMKS